MLMKNNKDGEEYYSWRRVIKLIKNNKVDEE